jgi:DNA-binding NarL/FixJ family response regulator
MRLTAHVRGQTLARRSKYGAAELLSDLAWTEVARSLKLSNRELQISKGVFDNLTESAIGEELGMSEHTVHAHLNRLFRKLRVRTRVQLVLRVTLYEVLLLTVSDASSLPPICRHRANGRCTVGC